MKDNLENIETTEIMKDQLNYEGLLSRAIDRCLHFRTVDYDQKFPQAVRALSMGIVDMSGKPMKQELKDYLQENPKGAGENLLPYYERVFEKITDILSKNKMLFRSSTVEIGKDYD